MSMRFALALFMAAAIISPAFAHTGVGSHFGFVGGITHPLFGLDHLLTMVGVGVWAALVGGKARWLWPAAFVTIMAAGAALALNSIVVPHVESLILASVIGVGAAVAFGLQVPLVAGATICAAFAIAHGHAHGNELPTGASVAGYVAGFMISTAALHAIGIAAGMALQRSRLLARLAGASIAAAGALLAFA
jgi:urease accessory protein